MRSRGPSLQHGTRAIAGGLLALALLTGCGASSEVAPRAAPSGTPSKLTPAPAEQHAPVKPHVHHPG